MEIPKYIQKLLHRADFDYFGKDGEPGYTIRIHKHSDYAFAGSLSKEVKRLCDWVDRCTPEGLDGSKVLLLPTQTRFCDQFAVVTIYDPVMRQIEKYIESGWQAMEEIYIN